MKKRGWITADPLPWAATGLLGVLAIWSMALSFLFGAPATPTLLAGEQQDTTRGHVVLLVPPGGEARARAAAEARGGLPALPLHVVTLPTADDSRTRAGHLWSLLHSYGYDRLPVMLVLDKKGRVAVVSAL
jgi:hypothetical protein